MGRRTGDGGGGAGRRHGRVRRPRRHARARCARAAAPPARGRLDALLREVGRFEDAHRTAVEGLDRARELGERHEEAAFLGDVAGDLFRFGRHAESAELFEAALLILLDAHAQQTAVSSLVTAIRTGPREVAEANLAVLAGLLQAARDAPDRVGPAAALDVAVELVVEWFHGRPVVPHTDLVATVDGALGTALADLLGVARLDIQPISCTLGT